MVSSCGAVGCKNRGGKEEKNEDGTVKDKTAKRISFHHLPKEKNLRDQWLHNIRREGEIPKKLVICSEHFESSCFKRDLQVTFHKISQMLFVDDFS